jgi:transcriptional regulator with XRE-family HTH domain
MPPKTIKSSLKIGEIIKNRRNELNLTIEEAALKSGLGTKTWSRYESGASIRRDKVKGICKTLKWKTIPETDEDNIIDDVDFNEYRKSETWSPFLEEHYGKYAALSFVIGSDILLDDINDDLAALSKMPRGSHIGEIPCSIIATIMPEQFLVRYDYEFMFALRQTLIWIRKKAPRTKNIIAHRVIDELVLYLIEEESESFFEEMELNSNTDAEDDFTDWRGWAFDIFDDMDIVSYLYSDLDSLPPEDTYHFDNWFKQQFYVQEVEDFVEEDII